MKIEYKGKKWDKEVESYRKMIKASKVINKNELYTISKFEDTGYKDYLRLYGVLSSSYARLAEYYYLDNINNKEIIKYTYLSGYAMLLTKRLYEKGIRTKYNEVIVTCILGNMTMKTSL